MGTLNGVDRHPLPKSYSSGQSMRARRTGGGGHATAGGVDFQARVAAWLGVGMLAETEFEPPWGWPRNVTIDSVRSETGESADDIWVRVSSLRRAFLQAKRSLNLEEAAGSEFGKALRQFANQYISCHDRIDGREPLDPSNDRLVLAVGGQSSEPIRLHLPALLHRLRNWPTDRRLTDAASNVQEARALRVSLGHLNRAFHDRTGVDATDVELRQLLALMTVGIYDFGDGGSTEREALSLLRRSVVVDPGRAGDAWNALCHATIGDAAGQSGMDRRAAQDILRRESIALRAPRSYRDDIAKLTAHTDRTLGDLKALSDIALRRGRAKIARMIPAELERLVDQSSCVVVGDPGSGKSATLYELAYSLKGAGADVIVLAADRLAAGSLGALRSELNLQREIVEVLASWPTQRGVLLIDALDAARGDRTQQALLDLLEGSRRHAPHWTIVASIRRFDLRYNQRLQQMFPVGALPAAAYIDPEFVALSHLSVALLSDAEIGQLQHLAPDVYTFLAGASAELQGLVRVPFNLRLLMQLLDADVNPAELHPIRTQLELLNLYWQLRVLTPLDGADLSEALLLFVCELIVAGRSMRVSRADIQPTLLPALRALLSSQLLVESTGAGGSIDRSVLGYAHHVLFDYAAARLLLRRPAAEVVGLLAGQTDLPILIRPSLDLHLRWLWESEPDHVQFWEVTMAIAAHPNIPEIATLVGTGIAAEMVRTLDDVAPLLGAVTSAVDSEQKVGERVLAHVLASVQTFGLPIAGDTAGPWAAIVAQLSEA